MNWTYVGILIHRAWGAALLVNFPGGYTKALVAYDRKTPVRIREIAS